MIQTGDEPIPGYRVEQMLGRGQYGEVWRASTPGQSAVALKFLDMKGLRGWKEFRAVQRVKQIRHAHLMPIVAIWLLDAEGTVMTDDALDSLESENPSEAETLSDKTEATSDRPASMIVATLLGDQSLRDRLEECLAERKEGVPVRELLGYMEEAAKGIDHLNSVQHDWDGGQVGVQHCDIKPDNVMLMGGSIVICDFGVAQIFAHAEYDARATSLSGSPAYMAPESFEARPSQASDQYSLAVMYYELRTGQLPLDASSFAIAYESHRAGSLDFSLVNEREQAILCRATDVNPERRYGSAGDFVRSLKEATLAPTRQTATRQGLPLGWIAAAAVLLLSSIGFLLQRPNNEPTPDATEIVLQFGAPNARVFVNDEEFVANSDGVLTLDVPPDEAISISTSNNEGRKDAEWTITSAELSKESTFDFSIPYTADHYAEQANELLAQGHFDKAVESLALAVQDDPEQYALFPEPQTLETSGLLWEKCLQVAPSGEWFAVGGKDGLVRRYRLNSQGASRTAEELQRHDQGRVMCLAVDDKLIVSACDRGTVWITHDDSFVELFTGEGMEIDLAITDDSHWLVAAVSQELNTQLRAWDLAAWHRNGQLPDPRSLGDQPGEFPRLVRAWKNSVVLATKDVDSLVWKWQIDPPQHEEAGRQENDILSLSASDEGAAIAYAGVANSNDNSDADEAAIVDIRANSRYPLAWRQSDSILACSLSGDGELLATSERTSDLSGPGVVRLWKPNASIRAASVERSLQFDTKLGDVSALGVSRHGEWVVAGHSTGGVSLWPLASPESTPFLTFGHSDRVVTLKITPDGRRLISGSRDGRLMIIDLERLQLLHRACQRAGVQPRMEQDNITLLDRSGSPVPDSPMGIEGIAYFLSAHPNARRAG